MFLSGPLWQNGNLKKGAYWPIALIIISTQVTGDSNNNPSSKKDQNANIDS